MISRLREYEILEKVGEGGMGAVFKAKDSHLDRLVAIKALHPTFTTNNELTERFKQEARVQAHLFHPNIVNLYNFFEESGYFYIVMEYIQGETLANRIRRTGLIPPQVCIPIFNQILTGLGFAHSKGVIHRDLKPSNILIDADNQVKIMDFGVAKIIGDRSMTKTGTKMGTIYYMSPEQVLGEKDIDGRADIYSLGITLFEMLTGRLPFKTEGSDFMVMQQIVQNEMPSVKTYYPYVPDNIDQAILKATRGDRTKRFKTCAEFQDFLNDENSNEYQAKAPVASDVSSEGELSFQGPPIAGLPGSLFQPANANEYEKEQELKASAPNKNGEFSDPELNNGAKQDSTANDVSLVSKGIGGWLLIYCLFFFLLIPLSEALHYTGNMREIAKKEQPPVTRKKKLPPEAKPDWSESLVIQIDDYLGSSQALNNIHSDILSVPIPRLLEYSSPLGRSSYYLELGFAFFFFTGSFLFLLKFPSAQVFNLNLWRILFFCNVLIIGLNIRILYMADPNVFWSIYTDKYLIRNAILLFFNIVCYLYIARSKRIRATCVLP